jgi:4-hydroxybenzoate polyprenyltransferase
MDLLNWESLQLPLASSIIAFGFGGLKPPRILQDLYRNTWFQWMMVFVLIYVVGARQNLQLAALATLIVFLIVNILDLVYDKKDGFRN